MWQIEYKFERSVLQPGDKSRVSIRIGNIGLNAIPVSEVGIQFDWQGDYWYPLGASVLLNPQEWKYIDFIDFEIPSNIAGTRCYRFGFKSYEWMDPEWTDWKELTILVFPIFKAFVSRLTPPQEKEKVQPLLDTIKDWGFKIYTYEGPNDPLAPYIIAQHIKEVDCQIVIATSQVYDSIHGMWQTSPWVHREFFGSFVEEKPQLIFRERDVYFDGLLSPTVPSIEFSSIEEACQSAHDFLPEYRKFILSEKEVQSLPRIGAFVGGAIVGGIIGLAIASARSQKTA